MFFFLLSSSVWLLQMERSLVVGICSHFALAKNINEMNANINNNNKTNKQKTNNKKHRKNSNRTRYKKYIEPFNWFWVGLDCLTGFYFYQLWPDAVLQNHRA